MKVTKVVDKGSLRVVPKAMSMLAIIRFTEPRIRSKAAPSSSWVTEVSMRRLIQRLSRAGKRSFIQA